MQHRLQPDQNMMIPELSGIHTPFAKDFDMNKLFL